MIWQLHMRQILLNILMLFGKEFIERYFPRLIMVPYQSIISENTFLLCSSISKRWPSRGLSTCSLSTTHWCSDAWSWHPQHIHQVHHQEVVLLAHSSEEEDHLKRFFNHLCHVHSWGRIFPMMFCLFPHFTWTNKNFVVRGGFSLSCQGLNKNLV